MGESWQRDIKMTKQKRRRRNVRLFESRGIVRDVVDVVLVTSLIKAIK